MPLPRSIGLLANLAIAAWTLGASQTPARFLTQPYLQLGNRFADGTLSVVWHVPRQAPALNVEWRYAGGDSWDAATIPDNLKIEMPDRTVFEAVLPVEHTGRMFEYRFRAGGDVVFSGRGTAPARAGSPFSFAVIGDGGDGSREQRALAARLLEERAAGRLQLIVLAGDLVYECGRREEYARNFFPIYNGDAGSAGVPLMRDVVFAGAAGNHDVGFTDLIFPFTRCSTDYSYFSFWKHPVGFAGPLPINLTHPPRAPSSTSIFRRSDLPRVLSRANFSFNWGDAHFVLLDSNPYVDWANAELAAWLDRDLAQARSARWRFVVFHHPPFNLSRAHEEQQWMRALAPVFERHDVAVVFAGHVHNFQWFGPATFVPGESGQRAFVSGLRGRLTGALRLQAGFDGAGNTRATAPVYVVSGAGGHELKNQPMQCPENLVPRPADCTSRAVVDGRSASATIVSVDEGALRFRRVTTAQTEPFTRTITRR